MELRQYLVVLQRRWWVLLAGTLLAASGGYLVSKQLPPIYQAQSTLILNLATQSAAPTYQDVTTSQALTKTYAQVITARSTLEEAAARLGGGVTASALRNVSGTDVPLTELLKVSFESRDPRFAAGVVNTVSEVFAERVRTAQLGQTGDQQPANPPPNGLNTIFILDRASVPRFPVSPSIPLNTALAGIAGLILATAVVLVLEYLDDTVQGLEELGSLELNLMGTVHRVQTRGVAPNVLLGDNSQGAFAERYRQLRTNLEFAGIETAIKTLIITSCRLGEGKTTTACNLAVMLARAGQKVILVDADLRRPSVHTFFNMDNQCGLTTGLFAAPAAVEGLLHAGPSENLRILTSGPLPPNPSELLSSKRMSRLIIELRDLADIVVFDTPPTVSVADTSVLAARVDAVLLVVDAGRTRASTLRFTVDVLGRSRVRLLGAVLNKVKRHGGRGNDDFYYYHRGRDGTNGPDAIPQLAETLPDS